MRAAVLLVIWLAAAPPCLARRKAAASATRGGEKPVNVVMLRPRFLAPLIPSEVAARPAGMGRDAARLALTIDAGEAGLKGELDSLADALPASRPVDISPADVAQLARRAAPRAGGTGPPGAPTREGAAAARRALAGLMDAAECTDAAVFDAAAAVRGGSDESGGGRRHRCPKAMFRLAVELKSGGAIDSAAEALGALEAQEAEAAAAAAGGRAGAPGPAARARAAARGALLRLLRGAVCRPPMTPERKRAARSQAVDSFLAAAEGRGSGLGSPDFDDSTIAATITHLSGVSVMAGLGPVAEGRTWRFRGRRYDGAFETGAGVAADKVLTAEPMGAVISAAVRVISDQSAPLEERTEAVLLLAGLLNAAAQEVVLQLAVRQLALPATAPALAAGLARWAREQREADGATDAGSGDVPPAGPFSRARLGARAFSDPLEAIVTAAAKASRRGAAVLAAQPELAQWAERHCAPGCGAAAPPSKSPRAGAAPAEPTALPQAVHCSESKTCVVDDWRSTHRAVCHGPVPALGGAQGARARTFCAA